MRHSPRASASLSARWSWAFTIGGKLTWAGNVGTGFDRKMMEAIHAKLAPLATEKCPLEPDKDLPREVTWTRPELVCEVRFSNWTEEGRLRAPGLPGPAPDIDPQECVRDRLEVSSEPRCSIRPNPKKHAHHRRAIA